MISEIKLLPYLPEIEEYANNSKIRIVKMSAKEEAEEKGLLSWLGL